MKDEKFNNSTNPEEGSGTEQENAKEDEQGKEEQQAEKVVIDGREFPDWETAAKEMSKSWKEAERKMHEATTQLAQYERERMSQEQEKLREKEEKENEELADEILSNPVQFKRKLTEEIKQAVMAEQMRIQMPLFISQAKEKYSDFDKYEKDIKILLDAGIAQGHMQLHPDRYAGLTPVDVAYAIAKAPHWLRMDEEKRVEAERQKNLSSTPPPTGKEPETIEDIELTPEQKEICRQMGWSEKDYKEELLKIEKRRGEE